MAVRILRLTAAITCGATLGVAVISGWYIITPKMTVEAMAMAAANGDGKRLAAYMDMDALRADMRRRTAIALSDRFPLGSNRVIIDPRRVTEALAGKVIDDVFSRKGTDRILSKEHGKIASKDVTYVILRGGPNNFTARLDSPRRVDLLFSRQGAGWRLSGIAMRAAGKPELII